MKSAWLKLGVSLLMCTVITTVLLVIMAHLKENPAIGTVSVPVYHGHPPIEEGLGHWLKEGMIFMTYLIIYGHWLLFIPGLVIFWYVTQHKPSPTYSFHLLLGMGVGLISSIVFYGLASVLPPWSISPSKPSDWMLIVMYGMVGAVYGLLYRKWFIGRVSN